MSNPHPSYEDQLTLDLQDSGNSGDVILNREIALKLYEEFRRTRKLLNDYQQAKNQVLDLAILAQDIHEDERDGYKDFIHRQSQRAAKKGREQAKEMRSIPFAPLEAYEDDMH